MQKASWLILFTSLVLCVNASRSQPAGYEYPSALLDAYDADGSCWSGMDASGVFPAAVVPETWLVGPPPSPESAVTLPADHWVDLAFSGRPTDGDGNDIVLVETGKAGEQALLFVTDGVDQEYLLTEVAIENAMKQELSRLGFDLDGISLPFVPRVIRVVALDRGGQSPGFDLGSVLARVSHDCGMKASCPNPLNGAAGVNPSARLTWTPGASTDRQVIYFGEVASEVRAGAGGSGEASGLADGGSANVRYELLPRDVNTFEPPALGLGRTYYWRVDCGAPVSVAPSPSGVITSPQPRAAGLQAEGGWATGDVWSFTVADHLTVDDFETYDLRQRFLYETWQTRGRAGASLEQEIVKSCRQSLSFQYQYDSVWSSEVVRVFEEPQDWTRLEAKVLHIMLHGTPGNATRGRMYLAIGDGSREQMTPYAGDLAILADPGWHAWRIALADFNSVNLSHVTSIAVGLRPATPDPQERGRGTIYLDDVTLHPALCLGDSNATGRRLPDLTADCTVDCRDLERLAAQWLDDRTRVLPATAPNEPILWYKFEGNAEDSAGAAHGQMHGRCGFVTGVHGQAICFKNVEDVVTVSDAAGVFSHARDAITIAFWQRGDDSTHLNDTVCCSNYVYGRSNPAIAIHLGCWRNPGQYRWDCGSPWSFENRLAGRHQDKGEWAGRWSHWAFTKRVAQPRAAGISPAIGGGTPSTPQGQDALATGRMEIYLNGKLYDSREGTDTPITGITSFEIGSGWYGRYDGAIDDFQIYDYALTPAEIVHAATRGTGVFPDRPNSPADFNADDKVNLHDLAILATEWLQDGLWP